ncbi:MAG TPA: hypothetical protein QGH10_15570 [Armatimonadota bacterium]|nr:hypothetical protein [Armatimonadota bacterium]
MTKRQFAGALVALFVGGMIGGLLTRDAAGSKAEAQRLRRADQKTLRMGTEQVEPLGRPIGQRRHLFGYVELVECYDKPLWRPQSATFMNVGPR